jgi:hypothetical protein
MLKLKTGYYIKRHFTFIVRDNLIAVLYNNIIKYILRR